MTWKYFMYFSTKSSSTGSFHSAGKVANKPESIYKIIFCLNLWSRIMLYVGNERNKIYQPFSFIFEYAPRFCEVSNSKLQVSSLSHLVAITASCTPGRRSEGDGWNIDDKWKHSPSFLDGLKAFLWREEHWKAFKHHGKFTNPFTQESNKLFNLVTKVVVPEKVQKDLVQWTKRDSSETLWYVCQRSYPVWED